MIRLRSLLEDITTNKPKVLFIGDATLKKNYNFANKLIHSKRIKPNSKIKIKSNGTSEDLLNILEDNVKNHYDLFVFFVTHIRTNNIMGLIENYQLAINTAHAHNSKIVVFTLPSIKFIRDTKKPISEREKSDRHEVNNWIRLNSNADFIIDTELKLDDPMYFESTGTEFNVEGHSFIYKQLLKIVNEINIDTDINSTIKLDTKHKLSINASSLEEIKQIHQLLISAGYYIDKNELTNNIIGKTTKLAILKYNSNINKRQSDDTDTQSDTGLTAVTPSIVSGDFSADVVKQAYELILKYEGFNATAKWDKTNWRIGHGSSTVTMADGSIYRLSNNRSEPPTITITKEDADRDLRRRVSDEFIPKVKKSLGSDAYDVWEAGTIAALTSICYNYGSLKQVIVDAAKSKITSTLVAAVRALGTDNAGINKNRRNKEADYIEAAENYIPIYSDTKDYAAKKASGAWHSLTNIFGNIVGGGLTVSAFGGEDEEGDGGKILGNNINIKVPAAGAHVGQSGWQSNNAWDIAAPVGTPVYAVNSGTVITFHDYGPKIISKNGKRLFGLGFTVKTDNSLPSVYYTHLKNPQVSKGSKVARGQLLGYIMDFPGSSFDHLHIGIESGDISQFITKDGTIKYE